MGNLSALVMVLEVTFIGGSAQSSDTQAKVESREQRTLEYALSVAGPDVASLPIELASVRHAGASPYADAWTTYSGEGKGLRIFVLRSTGLFRCASAWTFACVRMLASTLVHEAWHFNHGPDEAAAHEAAHSCASMAPPRLILTACGTNRDYTLCGTYVARPNEHQGRRVTRFSAWRRRSKVCSSLDATI
jgi:hypothetical protein